MVNYHVLNESIVLNYEGKTQTIAVGDHRYEEILQCIRDNRLEDIPAIVDIITAINVGICDTGIELRDDGLLWDGDTALPAMLSERILKFKELKLPYGPLFAFWERLKKNPSYNARQMLFKFLEHNGHPLTQDGCFIAYRGVTTEFKDAHSGKLDNTPGSVCEMPRDQVDDNPNNTCSAGLHVACFNYAKDFSAKLVEVKVSPEDVVCVPTDYNGTKMRTCKFEVLRECEVMRTEELDGHKTENEDGYCELDQEEESEEDRRARCLDEGICPSCEHSFDIGANFCSECGEDLN